MTEYCFESLHWERESHINYFVKASTKLSEHYLGIDSSRLTIIYFIVVALDLLKAIDSIDRTHFVEYIYQLYLKPSDTDDIHCGHCGFIGSTFMSHNVSFPDSVSKERIVSYQQGHVAMTYTALASLLTLGDDLSRINRFEISSCKLALS